METTETEKQMKKYKVHYEINGSAACGNWQANDTTTNPKKVTCYVCWKILR